MHVFRDDDGDEDALFDDGDCSIALIPQPRDGHPQDATSNTLTLLHRSASRASTERSFLAPLTNLSQGEPRKLSCTPPPLMAVGRLDDSSVLPGNVTWIFADDALHEHNNNNNNVRDGDDLCAPLSSSSLCTLAPMDEVESNRKRRRLEDVATTTTSNTTSSAAWCASTSSRHAAATPHLCEAVPRFSSSSSTTPSSLDDAEPMHELMEPHTNHHHLHEDVCASQPLVLPDALQLLQEGWMNVNDAL